MITHPFWKAKNHNDFIASLKDFLWFLAGMGILGIIVWLQMKVTTFGGRI